MSKFGKGNKMYAILNKKCPKCHGGDLFEKPFQMNKAFEMKDECTSCGQHYEMEPGFYWGAMYIAYGLSAGYLLVSFALCFFLFGLSVNQSLTFIFVTVMLMMVPIFRFARSIWVNLFISYNPNKQQDSIFQSK